MLKFKKHRVFDAIDPDTGKPYGGGDILVKWINDKLKKREWENFDRLSEVKYFISFVPLFHKKFINRKNMAELVGLSYDVFRKFLTEDKIKKLTDEHFNDFSSFFFMELLANFSFDSEGNLEKGKFFEFIRESGLVYSQPLLTQITNSIFYYRNEDIEAGLKAHEGQPLKQLEYLFALNASYSGFLDLWAYRTEKTDKNLSLKFRMMGLHQRLDLQNTALTVAKELLKDGNLDLSKMETICSMGEQSVEDVKKIFQKMK